MHDKDVSRQVLEPELTEAQREDAEWQGRVLGVIFHHYPDALTKERLKQELVRGEPTSEEEEAITRAVQVLIEANLLRREDSLIVVTSYALEITGLHRMRVRRPA